MEVKTLSQYAQEHGIGYRAAWDRFQAGKIPEAYQDECGRILIPVPVPREEYVVCYARVSSSENRKNLEAQAERLATYCLAKGYTVHQVVRDIRFIKWSRKWDRD